MAHFFDQAHEGTDNYMFSKQAINVYVASQAFPLLQRGIRINAILPGPTDTPLARANAELWLGFGTDYRGETGIEASQPDEQAGPLAFLCSDAARYVTGEVMIVDAGYTSSGITGTFESAIGVVQFMAESSTPMLAPVGTTAVVLPMEAIAGIEVKAAAVNPSDVKAATGLMPYAVFPRTPGRDYAGVVIDGPAGAIGREVFGSSGDLGIRRDGTHGFFVI